MNFTYLCFLISFILPFPYPNRSTGLSRHNFFINIVAVFPTLLGNSTTSIPFRIMLYVFIGSDPANGGLQ